jgi:hypothetical protein
MLGVARLAIVARVVEVQLIQASNFAGGTGDDRYPFRRVSVNAL